MELEPNIQSFSVDFLLSELAATAIDSPPIGSTDRLVQAAQQAQRQAEATGDQGAVLVTQVEQYLAEATNDLEQFAAIARQLGGMCADHSIEHELSGEAEHTAATSHAHAHDASSHAHTAQSFAGATRTKKRKPKKRQRKSLLDIYLWRLRQTNKVA